MAIKRISDIATFFTPKWFTGSQKSGSGKALRSFGRSHAIQINATNPTQIYSIYKDYNIIFAIINDITNAVRNTPIWISSDNRKEIKDFSSNKFIELNKKPNRFYTGNLAAEVAFEIITFGRAFIIEKNYTSGSEYFLLKNIDIQNVEYVQKGYSERVVSKITYKKLEGGVNTEIAVSSGIYEISYNKVTAQNSEPLIFTCPIVSVRSEIEAYANMIDALSESYSDSGARKIISFKNGDGSYAYVKEVAPDEEEKLHEKFKESYGQNKGDRKFILSQQEVAVHDLAISPRELDIVSSKPALEMSICNAFNYPAQLLGIKSGAYKSLTEAEEAFYIRCVSPLANYILNSLNVIFKTNIKGTIELDYSEYDFFAAMKAKKGGAIQSIMQGLTGGVTAGIFSKEEAQDIFNEIM